MLFGKELYQLWRQSWHCTMLGADIGANFYCTLMSLSYGHTLEDASAEGACERVASANSIGNLNLWSFLERLATWSKYIAAIYTAGQYEHVEIVFTQDEPTLVFDIQTRISKEATYGNKLLVVNLQHIATLQAFADNLLCIEILT